MFPYCDDKSLVDDGGSEDAGFNDTTPTPLIPPPFELIWQTRDYGDSHERETLLPPPMPGFGELMLYIPKARPLRGFAALKAAGGDVSAISRKGGVAVHAQGKAHVFTHEEAVAAGKISGRARSSRRIAAAKKVGT